MYTEVREVRGHIIDHIHFRLWEGHPKMKFSIKDFFSKWDQIRRKQRIWSHLLKKSLMRNLFFVRWLIQKLLNAKVLNINILYNHLIRIYVPVRIRMLQHVNTQKFCVEQILNEPEIENENVAVLNLRNIRLQAFFQKTVLKNLAKFTREHRYWSFQTDSRL